jgi:glycosyltransferase involved in cell wall biosynthesis
MKVLLSAYACAPGRGSEPEIGWNWMQQLARRHEVWVITRAKNRASIERGLQSEPAPAARFIYVDLPKPLQFWKKWPGGVYLYYYLWQLLAWRKARALHREIHFDRAQHVTFGMFWQPSFMALLPVPFVWGPVGGGESAPKSFRRTFGVRGRTYEFLRRIARALGALDPSVRMTARRCALALASTPETAERLKKLGCKHVEVETCCGIDALPRTRAKNRSGELFYLFSAGRLLHWKGFHLALHAIAQIRDTVPTLEYSIFGTGPERKRLERLANDLHIAGLVHFHDSIPRAELLQKMAGFDVMLHPSLHDSGGFVCLEAMSAGCPVVCLDLGGPALQVTAETGFKIAAVSPEQTVRDLAAAIEELATNPDLRARLSHAARERVKAFSWERKLDCLEPHVAHASACRVETRLDAFSASEPPIGERASHTESVHHINV